MENLEEKREQLREIKKSYYSGVLRVKFGETDITYKSELQMRRTIQQLETELGVRPKARIIRPLVGKGL